MNVLATAYLTLLGSRLTTIRFEAGGGQVLALPLPALYIMLLLLAIGWAYLLVGAGTAGLGAYVLAAAYIAYYSLLMGFSLAGTPWFVLTPIGRLFHAPLVWLVILLATAWRTGRWQRIWDGLVYAVTTALGFVTLYTDPPLFSLRTLYGILFLVPVPALRTVMESLLKLEAGYMTSVIWPTQARWWWILLSAAGAAAILGSLMAWAHGQQGWRRILCLALALAGGLAFLAFCQLVLRVR